MESVANASLNKVGQTSAEYLAKVQLATDYGSWWWFLFTTVLLAILWYGIQSVMNIAEIVSNWPKYRCSPSVMPFASFYGYDTGENFQYCMKQIFQGQVGGVTGPFATIMATMIQNLSSFMKNLNSLRVMMATLVGGVTKIFQEFVDRFRLALSQFKLAALKIQMLMKRVFGTMYAMIYMGLSGVTAGLNFADTFIFKFLDVFCFAPTTIIEIQGKGHIEIQDVKLGDICSNGARVVSTYRFIADGQPMVWIGGTKVSSNHLVKYGSIFVSACEHPDSWASGDWLGGSQEPLICLDTNTHEIPIDGYTYSDWDETHESDSATMNLADSMVNGTGVDSKYFNWKYQPAYDPSLEIRMKNGTTKRIVDLQLGDEVSTGRITGIGKRLVQETVLTPHGSQVTPSTLVWNGHSWIRAGFLADPVLHETPLEFLTLIVLSSATVEVTNGDYFRDMLEVHSPHMEDPTSQVLR
jgi:hypothetical protein